MTTRRVQLESVFPTFRFTFGGATTVAVMVCATTLSAFASTAATAERRPNVIILMPDQMRGCDMGVAGNPDVRTPAIDRLARDGLYLPNTIANNPVCCPARATILTGTYPHTHGMIVNDLRLKESVVTLAERLAQAGYATGFVGKWHLDGGSRLPGFVPPGERRQGFGFWAANVCNHNHFDSAYFRDTPEPIKIDRFEPEVWTDEAIRFIRENHERPFFLWWTCGPPHNPYGAPEKYERLYDPAKLTMRPNYRPVEQFGTRQDIAKYYAAITAIDDQIGRLMEELDKLGLTEDTLVLFTSDHGDMLGAHGMIFKSKPHEESIRVPGIVRYPRRIAAGQTRDLLFSHVDIAPTVLSFCGVNGTKGIQGNNLRPHLEGEAASEPDTVFLQFYEPRPQWGTPAAWRGVRTKRHTYARFRDQAWVLFDLEKDPYQQNNLADRPEWLSLQAELDGLIHRRMAHTGDSWEINLIEYREYYKGSAVYHPDELKEQNARP